MVTRLENKNSLLFNHFAPRYAEGIMIMRVDKCSTFGIKKASTFSMQYPPKILIDKNFVPAVKNGKYLRYVGLFFNHFMDDKKQISDLLEVTKDLLCKINDLPCHPKNKLLLNCCSYIFSLLRV